MAQGNNKPRLLSSRGIPAQESLWLDGLENRKQCWEYNTGSDIDLSRIIQLVFPQKYQPILYAISLEFMELLLENKCLDGKDIRRMLETKKFSKATFYNRVLPRLKLVGMIRAQKINGDTRKIYEINDEFSNFFEIVCMEYKKIILKALSGRYKKRGQDL